MCVSSRAPTNHRSLSARRAWIEMAQRAHGHIVHTVALRKESVDRNEQMGNGPANAGVALRKESVDRNRKFQKLSCAGFWSLSARRAWIEIFMIQRKKEKIKSLSARRAWIEIDRVSKI